MSDTLLRRTVEFENVRAEDNLVPCVLSTDVPVNRGNYLEVLQHDEAAVDLSRAPLPLIESHDSSRVNVGLVEQLRVAGGKLRGMVRFGTSARGKELLADVKAGIVRGLSIGYRIDKTTTQGDTLIATRWTPFELSACSVPADIGAGFYRGLSMSTENASAERTRATEILALGKMHRQAELAEAAVSEGASLDQFRTLLLSKISTAQPSVNGLDWSPREAQRYNIVNAIRAQLDPKAAARDCGFELEASRALERTMGKPAQGVYVPWNAPMQKRDITTSTTTGTPKGGYLVPTDMIGLIDVLRAKLIMPAIGVTVLQGLSGNVALPRKTTSVTSYWVAENVAPTEGTMAFDQVALTPKTMAAYVDFSRRFLLQSSVDATQLVQDDLAASMAHAIEVAFFGSTNTSGPTGVRGVTGLGSVAGGTNGLALSWGNIVALIRAPLVANTAGARLAFVTNEKVRAKLMTTLKTTADTASNFIIGDNGASLAGYPFFTSNAISSTLVKGSSGSTCSAMFFGDWSEMVHAIWGGACDLLVDPYTGSSAGTVRVTAFTDQDFGCRQPAALAACLDILTV